MTDPRAIALIIAPVDPLGPRVGGIQTFVTGFAKFAPPELGVEIVGVSSSDGSRLDPGAWGTVRVGQADVPMLPLLRVRDTQGRHRVPLSLRFVAAAIRRRSLISTRRRVLQFHRPATALPFLLSPGPKVQLIHHELAQIAGGSGDNRWSALPTAFNWIEHMTAGRMDAVIAVNEETAEAFRQRHPAAAGVVQFVPNWVDDTIFRAGSSQQRLTARAVLRRAIGAPADDPVILVAGRFETAKDPLLAIDAFAVLAARVPTAHLVMVGAGTLESVVARRLADLHQCAHLLGRRSPDELAEIMRGADGLLVSSRTETGPTVALEALACGLPVVGPHVGRLPRILTHRRTGWLAATRSPKALASGLSWVTSEADPGRTAACVTAAEPYHARTVLEPLYGLHLELARRALRAR